MFLVRSLLYTHASLIERTRKAVKLGTLLLISAVPSQVVLGMPAASNTDWRPAGDSHGPTYPEGVKDFLDHLFIKAIQEAHIPGAVFILVKDGKIFFSKGYGFADLETPVDPDKTLFRAASISKLFTATAVMQLVEEGQIDLNEDINKYLGGFQIKYRYERPITVANLLTHTDDFDVQWYIGRFARSQSELKPLGQFLAQRLPPQVEKPGSLYLYSDVGMTLAGYLVEQVSGSPFSQYIEERIFKPLDMRSSTFQQPLPTQMEDHLAVGYYKGGQSLRAIPFLYFNSGPAGALSSTATDIAHFMIAHLQNGKYGGVRILREETAQDMHRRHFSYDPRIPGVAYGFHVNDNYPRRLYHGGAAPGFSSRLVLLPDEGIGFFLALNIQDPELVDRLSAAVLNHFYPAPEALINAQPTTDFREVRSAPHRPPLEQFAGVYRYDQYPRHTLDKIGLLPQEWFIDQRIEVGKDGTLILFPGGSKWIQVEPLVFRQVDGKSQLVFGQDHQGHITEMFKDGDILRYERLAWYETVPFQKGLIAFFALAFLTTPVIALSGYLTRLSRGRKSTHYHKPFREKSAARYMAVAVSVLHLCFMIGMLQFLQGADTFTLIWGVPADLKTLHLIPPVSALITVPLSFLILRRWKSREGATVARLYYSVITLVAIAFLLFLNNWNLLNF